MNIRARLNSCGCIALVVMLMLVCWLSALYIHKVQSGDIQWIPNDRLQEVWNDGK